MKVILSVDALAPALTGIGRYTWELACRLGAVNGVEQLRFYRNQRWIPEPGSLLVPAPDGGTRSLFKPKARTFKWPQFVKNGYWQHMCRGQVFHGPNYFLPPYAERGVITVHDLSIFKFPETHPAERLAQFDKSFRQSLDLAAHLITDTEAVRQEVIAFFGWQPERVTAVHLGVSPGFRPRTATELVPGLLRHGLVPGQYCLCVSTIEPRKRIGALLTAYGLLPMALRTAYPLVLVGGKGWNSALVHAQMDAAERAGWLRYLGFVPEEDLPLLYAGARLFAYPSIYEGFGLPVAEAMASGVPVLTSSLSCLPEVADGAACLVHPDDTDALCQALDKSLTDNAWREAAVARGLQVAAGYSWQTCAQQTVNVYRKLV
nr:glycosyltransferase family 1 protein [Rhodoferax sp.]